MGQNNSEIIAQGTQSHERLGVIKVFEASDLFNPDETLYRLELKKNLQSEEKFLKWQSQLKEIDSEEARDVLYLPLSFKYDQTAICGSSGTLAMTFEHFPYVLKSEIKNRRKMSQFFQESQLWYLLYNLVEAGTIFEKKNKKLGDIHPNNCLLNENGQFKIISSYSLPDETTNYDKIVDSATTDAFLAPQEIDSTLLEKGVYPNVDFCRAEVYCIGMTLLEAATLQDCFYTYNRGPYKINKKRLADLLKIVRDKYRKPFYDFLFNMLEEQAKRRRKCSEIFNELRAYEEAILQLKDFALAEGEEKQNSVIGKTIDKGGYMEQTSNSGQKGFQAQLGYTQNSYQGNGNGMFSNSGNKGYPMNYSNKIPNYVQGQFQGQTVMPYGTLSYSSTSIDNGLKR